MDSMEEPESGGSPSAGSAADMQAADGKFLDVSVQLDLKSVKVDLPADAAQFASPAQLDEFWERELKSAKEFHLDDKLFIANDKISSLRHALETVSKTPKDGGG